MTNNAYACFQLRNGVSNGIEGSVTFSGRIMPTGREKNNGVKSYMRVTNVTLD